jgi:hypothetical protein
MWQPRRACAEAVHARTERRCRQGLRGAEQGLRGSVQTCGQASKTRASKSGSRGLQADAQGKSRLVHRVVCAPNHTLTRALGNRPLTVHRTLMRALGRQGTDSLHYNVLSAYPSIGPRPTGTAYPTAHPSQDKHPRLVMYHTNSSEQRSNRRLGTWLCVEALRAAHQRARQTSARQSRPPAGRTRPRRTRSSRRQSRRAGTGRCCRPGA